MQAVSRIRRDLTSGQMIPSGDLWPRFIYRNFEYNPQDPWDGLLRSSLLLKVNLLPSRRVYDDLTGISLSRLTNTYSRRQVLFMAQRARLHGLATLASMA